MFRKTLLFACFFILISACNAPQQEPAFSSTPDTEIPAVSFQNLSSGDSVSGRAEVKITATDNLQVVTVRLYSGASLVGNASRVGGTSVYTLIWDVSSLSDGDYTLKAEAEDFYGNLGQSTLSVRVDNSFVLVSPYSGQTVSGNWILKARVSDTSTVSTLKFQANGTEVASGVYNPESGFYEGNWVSPSNGGYTVKAVLTRSGGEVTESSAAVTVAQISGMNEITDFGSNPGNLRMYAYVPSEMPGSGAGLVVALHGCSQTASLYVSDSGWNTLADSKKFYVVYPEQKPANNANICFNWFTSAFQQRGYKENASIMEMVEYMTSHYGIDSNKIFITGFSAGGCMTSVMLATYPEVFKGASIISGIGYGAAVDVAAAGLIMQNGLGTKTPEEWKNLFKTGYPGFTGPYSHKVLIFQGQLDTIVNKQNGLDLEEAWGSLKELYQTQMEYNTAVPGSCGSVSGDYECLEFQSTLRSYRMTNTAHQIPRNASTAGYVKNSSIDSSALAADFWGF